MIAAGNLTAVGSVSQQSGVTLTEYGPITAHGFSLSDEIAPLLFCHVEFELGAPPYCSQHSRVLRRP